MKAKPTNQKRIGKGYSCLPETHSEIERRRKAAGLTSTGKVLEATFKPRRYNNDEHEQDYKDAAQAVRDADKMRAKK